METCKHGSGAGSRKPTAEMRQGAECRAYNKRPAFAPSGYIVAGVLEYPPPEPAV